MIILLHGLGVSPITLSKQFFKGIHFPKKAQTKFIFILTDFYLFLFLIVVFKKNVVETPKECGVSFIVYTSIFGVNYPKFSLEINHCETE